MQVIDDLIRMLPAARRLTLKDFPYAAAQTASEKKKKKKNARHSLSCQTPFPNGLFRRRSQRHGFCDAVQSLRGSQILLPEQEAFYLQRMI